MPLSYGTTFAINCPTPFAFDFDICSSLVPCWFLEEVLEIGTERGLWWGRWTAAGSFVMGWFLFRCSSITESPLQVQSVLGGSHYVSSNGNLPFLFVSKGAFLHSWWRCTSAGKLLCRQKHKALHWQGAILGGIWKGQRWGRRQSISLGLTAFGVSVCEEPKIWEPSKQDVKKEMPPGSRNDQRCTNSFSYKMEVCRSQGRDEISPWVALSRADPTIGHCL